MADKKTKTTATKTTTEKTESKAQKFVRLAQARVPKALKSIYNIGNLGGAGYDSTPDQREKIAVALREAVESTITRLNKEQVKPTGFTL
jgi:hypothetical protein